MTASVRINTIKLDSILAGLKPKANDILDKVSEDIVRDAKDNAPVDTGALRNSLKSEKGEKEFQRVVSDGVEYGIYVEFPGVTRKWAGKPFLGPAVENNRKPFIEAWEELVK